MKATWMMAALGAAPLLLTAAAAGAQSGRPDASGFSGVVALGAGAAPDFEGSADYEPIPFGLLRLSYDDISLQVLGPRARLGVSPIEGFTLGPAIRFRGGRDEDVENDAVAELPGVDDALEVGGFVGYAAPLGLTPGDQWSVEGELLKDVLAAHSGYVGSLSGSYRFRAAERLFLTTRLSTTFVSDEYAETYFSIDPAGAAASGLDTFDAEGGWHNVGLGLTANYQVTRHWGVTATGSATQLMGDAADSPIVDDEGDATQFFLGAGASYRF